jgi:CubicO group peptidase (beta-lactamase class C family)
LSKGNVGLLKNRWPSALSILWIALGIATCAHGQTKTALAADMRAGIDQAAQEALQTSGVPSASLAIVKDGQIVYTAAYGNARLEAAEAARPEMRYSIGSISKQFTATAVLMLAEEGKLSLDDPVSRFLPDLTRSNEVTIRQLLSHTAGYEDYWPQDYVPPFMLQRVTAQRILDIWAKRPLDFDPGTKWQYSNTNYVIAGRIVEKASGMPLLEFLSKRIFEPLHMQSVMNIDQNRLADTDATGYFRYALGPLRVAPKEGKGWLFAAGELAMPASDLATWDIAIMDQKLLKPESYRTMETDVLLRNGLDTQYGLGIFVRKLDGRRMLEHGGEVSGFTSENMVFPDDQTAVVVLTNQDASDGAARIGQNVAKLLLASEDAESPAKEQQARQIFEAFQKGKIDRALFTANGNSYFSAQAVMDFTASLAPLGAVKSCIQLQREGRGGMIFRAFNVVTAAKTVTVITYEVPGGQLEQYLVIP